ncbi:MAG: hypothetical protein HQL06_04110 [Nitrospirae bacterium]|nr:hypothetical protein [Nitrospirota bacterium]
MKKRELVPFDRVHKKLMGRPVIAELDMAIHKLIDSCFRRNDIISHDFLMHPPCRAIAFEKTV